MTNYLTLPVGAKAPEVVNCVIEIPLEGITKYEYDKDLHVFKLDRNLYSPVHYPGDYGFVPSTLSDDGDPLDVLVLVDAPSFPGCVMEVRPIGLLEMLDQGTLDEKVLAVGKRVIDVDGRERTSFDGFLEDFPVLERRDLLSAHYSSERLSSGRAEFVEPDLVALP